MTTANPDPIASPVPEPSPPARAFLDSSHGLLIGGRWANAADGGQLTTLDPATGRILARVASGGARDIDLAVAAAREAFTGPWSKMAGFERARLMRKLARLIEDNAALLSEVEILDNGMPFAIASMITGNCAQLFDYYAGWAERIEGTTTTPPPHVLAGGEALTYTIREAVGVIGQIIPWNVPLSMACLKLAPALAAGCTVVLKPAEETPLSALILGRLVGEAGFPDGVVNIVNGLGREAGARLVSHPDVDKIAFTGSTEVGKAIIREAAETVKKVSLELGGKSPVAVLADADLDVAIPGVAMATFFLQGQNCMAGTRIFVEDSIHDALVEGLVAFASGMKIGNGLLPETQLGPLISAQHRARVQTYIDIGISEGATLVTGGRAPAGPGFFLEPTIFTGVRPDHAIAREEIFGPVMAVLRVPDGDLEGLARLANDSVFGLSGSVWTRDLAKAHRLASRIRSGHVSINCHGAVAANIPFGGFKQSGWGREFGREGLDLYLETKAVTVRL